MDQKNIEAGTVCISTTEYRGLIEQIETWKQNAERERKIRISVYEKIERFIDRYDIAEQTSASETLNSEAVNLHTKKLFAIVHDGCGDHKDYKEAQAFTVYTSELEGLLALCKRDGKYIELEIDYSDELLISEKDY